MGTVCPIPLDPSGKEVAPDRIQDKNHKLPSESWVKKAYRGAFSACGALTQTTNGRWPTATLLSTTRAWPHVPAGPGRPPAPHPTGPR
jgi:hypothetical protein